MKKKRRFCPYCGGRITREYEEDVLRDYCGTCDLFFYDNPLPVVSTILVENRSILLVKRRNKPYRGKWCLPTGFAETDESIEEAALRELEEETGIKGRIISFVDVDSCRNYFYGDLIFLTFEVVRTSGGRLAPGSDTSEVKFYAIDRIPRLAFHSNTRAVQVYIQDKSDYWAIVDSFSEVVATGKLQRKQNLLSDRLVEVIRKNSGVIVRKWLEDVATNRSTPTYMSCNSERLRERAKGVLTLFIEWADEFYTQKGVRRVDVKKYFITFGYEKRKEGFKLHEVLSALSLKRKHIWQFALSYGIAKEKPLDIYMAFEFDRRMMIFFDRATFYTTCGYTEMGT